MPMLVRWPGRVPAGRVSDQVWAFWDFLPTAAELAGVAAPPDIDGISMAPALVGRPQSKEHEYLYWEFHEGKFAQAVRAGDWKLILPDQGKPFELYNLKQDAGEARNVAAGNAATVALLQGYLAKARTHSPYWPKRTP